MNVMKENETENYSKLLGEKWRFFGPYCLKGVNTIHWINHCSVDGLVYFVNTYPLDSNWGLICISLYYG